MTPSVEEHATLVNHCLTNAGLRCIAYVEDSDRAIDLAIALSGEKLAVVRCVLSPEPADHAAVATMIAEGDFVYGAIAHQLALAAPSPFTLEMFNTPNLDGLIARLREFGAANY